MMCMKLIRIDDHIHQMLVTLAKTHTRSIKGETEQLIKQEYIRYYVPDVGASPVGANVK